MDIAVHDGYESRKPSRDALIDLFKGEWVSRLPGTEVGTIPSFNDPRVHWAIERAGGVRGKRILELGPMEGGHSYLLSKAGAKSVLGIEANSKCFFKCEIVKKIYDLRNVEFEYGNFVPWLDENDDHFDYVQFAGVLYHMTDPLEVLSDVARITKQIYIWTQYADLVTMPENDPRYQAGIVQIEDKEWHGRPYRAFRRRYNGDLKSDGKFCGGVHTNPVWLEKSTILSALGLLGFDVEIAHDDPKHPNGPSMSIFAQRR
ncbi:class I SAM-dependent methyltransferase [Mesorhizobium huakuii]|uniref:Class I SAM-dependent methyltransferase n=1 Tax=Mesorhizobium huakuii TaxID=28104 RepID=A0ABZ0VKM0_9HYPH|nr:class I SAM-dependent methyltransferase [Mesorhizobium huakuii]WQB98014.1 class I SAM-dependent methyltransferase [Mesorhizobium huakuii]